MNSRREGDEWTYEWPEHDLGVVVTSPRDSAAGVWAEVAVRQASQNGAGHILGPLRVNLLEGRTRSDLAAQLARRTQGARVDWYGVIEIACTRTVREYRAGHPTIRLADVPEPQPGRDLIKDFLPAGETSVIFADGGTLKSTIALGAVGLAVAAGGAVAPGLVPLESGPVLFADWESNETEHRARLGGLCRYTGIPIPPEIYYRTQYRPLVDEAAWLRAEVARLGVRVLILDSLVPAVGGEPKDAQPVAALFNVLRSLGDAVTRVIVAHMAKAEVEKTNTRARVYGSIFVENLARSVWEVRLSEADDREDGVTVGLYHRKANWGRLKKPFGLVVHFDEHEAPSHFERIDVRDVADLADRLPLTARVRDVLRVGACSTNQIAERLGVTPNRVRAVCSRMNDVRPLFGTAGGAGAQTVWGLRAWEGDRT